jgi:hypothetical protein
MEVPFLLSKAKINCFQCFEIVNQMMSEGRCFLLANCLWLSSFMIY